MGVDEGTGRARLFTGGAREKERHRPKEGTREQKRVETEARMEVEEDSRSGVEGEERGEVPCRRHVLILPDRQSAVGLSASRKPNSPLCVV